MSVDDIPLEEIEESFNSDKTCTEQCPTMTSPAPPKGGGSQRISIDRSFQRGIRIPTRVLVHFLVLAEKLIKLLRVIRCMTTQNKTHCFQPIRI